MSMQASDGFLDPSPSWPSVKIGTMIKLPWGNAELSLPLPGGWRVLGTFSPASIQPEVDAEALCRQALAQPVGARPLSGRPLQGRRVLLVVDDQSRPTPVAQFFRPVRDVLLQSGVDPRAIEILFALGVHRPMNRQEAEAKIGADSLAAHRWHNHDCFDRAQLIYLGATTRGTPVHLNRLLTRWIAKFCPCGTSKT